MFVHNNINNYKIKYKKIQKFIKKNKTTQAHKLGFVVLRKNSKKVKKIEKFKRTIIIYHPKKNEKIIKK